jgi:hypothetical protein
MYSLHIYITVKYYTVSLANCPITSPSILAVVLSFPIVQTSANLPHLFGQRYGHLFVLPSLKPVAERRGGARRSGKSYNLHKLVEIIIFLFIFIKYLAI